MIFEYVVFDSLRFTVLVDFSDLFFTTGSESRFTFAATRSLNL